MYAVITPKGRKVLAGEEVDGREGVSKKPPLGFLE
jgi:hypothetical protein